MLNSLLSHFCDIHVKGVFAQLKMDLGNLDYLVPYGNFFLMNNFYVKNGFICYMLTIFYLDNILKFLKDLVTEYM